MVSDDQGGAGGERDGFSLLVNLHPEHRVLRGPEHTALHVYGGGPRGGDVGCDVRYCRRPLAAHNTETQLLCKTSTSSGGLRSHLAMEITMVSIDIILSACSPPLLFLVELHKVKINKRTLSENIKHHSQYSDRYHHGIITSHISCQS